MGFRVSIFGFRVKATGLGVGNRVRMFAEVVPSSSSGFRVDGLRFGVGHSGFVVPGEDCS